MLAALPGMGGKQPYQNIQFDVKLSSGKPALRLKSPHFNKAF
jgi:hypothetical protein